MWPAVLDALIDSLKALPILFVVYLLIELLEHKSEVKFEGLVASSKKYGPLWGSALGCIPQCGFSAVMADLYSRKMITIGTLFSVFVATSDEAFAILISNPGEIKALAIIIIIKLLLAIIIGYLIDILFKRQQLKPDNIEHSSHSQHEHSHLHNNCASKNKIETANYSEKCNICEIKEKTCDNCAHNHLHHKHELESSRIVKKSKVAWDIIKQALIHTAEIFAYILIANILINIIFQLANGEQILKSILGTNSWYQPIIACLLGLIPNCVGSVLIIELYIGGIISLSSCLGGLCTSAGIGLIILYKNNKNLKQNLYITCCLYLIGVLVGLIFNLFLPFKI